MSSQSKRALIVVDVQNDFCPGGSLAVARGDEVIEPLNKLIQEFLERGEPVFKTRDWHPSQTKHFADFGGAWPVHCVQNTKGAEFHRALLDDLHIRVISKGLGDEDSYSGFDGTDLALQLRRLGVEEVWVGGLATDYCVKNTVLDALKEGFRVKALADAMRPVELKSGDGARALNEMRDAGAEVVDHTQLRTQDYVDPVIEAYKDGIDLTLIRRNLALSVDERFEQLMSLQQLAEELRAAGKRVSG
ncbi:MAG: isochorismatase hydrolase [Acidobacteria bacterium]|nr:isochorismatase hydrolase [Acidobacteriota bacterium]